MKYVLYLAQSLDGFIANLNDETPWSDEEWEAWLEFSKQCDLLVFGRRTVEIMQEDGSINELDHEKIAVLTSDSFGDFFTIQDPSLVDLLPQLNEDSVVMIGGGQKANRAFLDAKLISEAYIDIESVAFGAGLTLGWTGTEKLELIDTKKIGSATTQNHYKVTYQ